MFNANVLSLDPHGPPPELSLAHDITATEVFGGFYYDAVAEEAFDRRYTELSVVSGLEVPSFQPRYERDHPLKDSERTMLEAVVGYVADKPGVQLTHKLMERKIPDVRQHCLRTAYDAGSMAVRAGLPLSEVILAVESAIVHDCAQGDPEFQRVKQSDKTFAEDPTLKTDMHGHTIKGGHVAYAAGCDENTTLVVIGHHSEAQKNRGEGYGTKPPEHGFRTEHSRQLPHLRLVASFVMAADVGDSIIKAPKPELEDKGRRYPRDVEPTKNGAVMTVNSMPIDRLAKVVMTNLYLAA